MAKSKREIQKDYEQRTGYAAQAKYKKAYTKQIAFALNIKTDADILEHLKNIPNRSGYLKKLIRDDMNK